MPPAARYPVTLPHARRRHKAVVVACATLLLCTVGAVAWCIGWALTQAGGPPDAAAVATSATIRGLEATTTAAAVDTFAACTFCKEHPETCMMPGLYCPPSFSFPDLCPPGYFCPRLRTKTECPDGYFCRQGSAAPTPCPALTLCPPGTQAPTRGYLGLLLNVVLVAGGAGLYRLFIFMRDKGRGERAEEHERNTAHNPFHKKAKEIARIRARFAKFAKLYTVPIDLEFRQLTYTLDNGTCLLKSVTGKLLHGRLVAFMGPSGAGKTTLLRLLAGRLGAVGEGNIQGQVLVNEHAVDPRRLQRIVGFVPQDDIMIANLSVKENVRYSGLLRLPTDIRHRDKQARIKDVLDLLELREVRHTKVGDANERGVSGGQRKRASIGLELIANPSILFLDEPTSGLDSAAASQVMRTLRNLADSGILVVCVVHQPRYEIFEMFDDLCLLARGGEIAYLGPVKDVVPYFNRLGYETPRARVNIADWVIDVIAGETPGPGDPRPNAAEGEDPGEEDAQVADDGAESAAGTTPSAGRPEAKHDTPKPEEPPVKVEVPLVLEPQPVDDAVIGELSRQQVLALREANGLRIRFAARDETQQSTDYETQLSLAASNNAGTSEPGGARPTRRSWLGRPSLTRKTETASKPAPTVVPAQPSRNVATNVNPLFAKGQKMPPPKVQGSVRGPPAGELHTAPAAHHWRLLFQRLLAQLRTRVLGLPDPAVVPRFRPQSPPASKQLFCKTLPTKWRAHQAAAAAAGGGGLRTGMSVRSMVVKATAVQAAVNASNASPASPAKPQARRASSAAKLRDAVRRVSAAVGLRSPEQEAIALLKRPLPPFHIQVLVFFIRSLNQQVISIVQHAVELALVCAAGAILGVVYLDTDDTSGLLQTLSLTCLVIGMTAISSSDAWFAKELNVHLREHAVGYSRPAYVLAKCLAHVPLNLLAPAVYLTFYYTFSAPRASLSTYYGYLLLMQFVGTGVGYCVPLLVKGKAQLVGVIFPLICTMFSGVSPSMSELEKIGLLGKVMASLSYSRWTVELLFLANAEAKDSELFRVVDTLQQLRYSYSNQTTGVLVLIAMALGFRLLVVYLLYRAQIAHARS